MFGTPGIFGTFGILRIFFVLGGMQNPKNPPFPPCLQTNERFHGYPSISLKTMLEKQRILDQCPEPVTHELRGISQKNQVLT